MLSRLNTDTLASVIAMIAINVDTRSGANKFRKIEVWIGKTENLGLYLLEGIVKLVHLIKVFAQCNSLITRDCTITAA